MTGFIIAIIFAFLLMVMVRVFDRDQGPKMLSIIMFGYVLRLILQVFVRETQFFSHEAGGDCAGYEAEALEIARLWRTVGFSFITSEEMPGLGPTALPGNLFATVIYINGGEPTRLGCTALVGLAAALTCFNIYHLALQFGANADTARNTITLFYLGPTYLHYTSDMFKDGLVACVAIGAFTSGLRLMRRISVTQIIVGILSLWGLWYVRYYLTFVAVAPLLVGVLGMRSKTPLRPLLAAFFIMTIAIGILELTDVAQQLAERASQTYEVATAANARAYNAQGGSGVTFDDGGYRYGQLWLKVLYTIFSPFPWGSGSVGFHVGKVDVFIIGFYLWRGWIAARTKELKVTAVMVMTFVVPCTIMYATSMANVGLIARQRLVIVVCFAFLASLYRPEMEKALEQAKASRRALSFANGLTKSRA
jgi:hypothetical protein